MVLSEDCFYSQVVRIGCCGDQGLLRIPISSMKDIRQQSCINYLVYRVQSNHQNIRF